MKIDGATLSVGDKIHHQHSGYYMILELTPRGRYKMYQYKTKKVILGGVLGFKTIDSMVHKGLIRIVSRDNDITGLKVLYGT